MNAVATFQPPRLPYNPVIQDRFGIDPSGWKALVEAIYPLAKTQDAVAMALSYCKARKLDPFKKPVHIVPMWDAKAGQDGNGAFVETVWPGISEVRTTAFRTGQYSGCDETEFGPEITQTFTAQKDKWENRRKVGTEEISVTVTFPEWARMTVYRDLGGRTCKFVGPKVYWLESYASQGKLDIPNTMWADRPIGQIEKCAEAAALRKAFPEEIGNDLTAEEMHGRRIDGDVAQVEAAAPAPKRQAPAAPRIVEDAEVVEVEQAAAVEAKQEPKPAAKSAPKAAPKVEQQDQQQAADAYNPAPILAQIQAHFDECDSEDRLELVRGKLVEPLYDRLSRSDQEAAKHIYNLAQERIAAADAERMQDDQQQDEKGGAGDAIEADGSAEDDTFPGDLPSKASAGTVKTPWEMTLEEYEAHVIAYTKAATDGEALKSQFNAEFKARERFPNDDRKRIRTVVYSRIDKLNGL